MLGPGDPLLDIVPVDQPLLVEVRLRPDDIELVHEGLPADVRLIAYKSGELPTFTGELVYVSADMLADPRSGESYFLARVRLDMAELAKFPRAALGPGMPAEVMVRTGERRAIDWLLARGHRPASPRDARGVVGPSGRERKVPLSRRTARTAARKRRCSGRAPHPRRGCGRAARGSGRSGPR